MVTRTDLSRDRWLGPCFRVVVLVAGIGLSTILNWVPGLSAESNHPAAERGAEHFTGASQNPQARHTGKKVALDFFDTDIRNVFRILSEISEQNFAVDKDVTGRVTLALDKPVAWNQVLDVVLKMNQLGMRREGEIIRIARRATLAAEDQDSQARQRVEALQTELATEYISVNYAHAEKDILSHVQAILSSHPDGSPRGTAQVDLRNNMLIVTDLPAVVRRAGEMVRKLDRVTPQVLIEARIVEAQTEFSRSLGVRWNLQVGIQGNDPRAGIGPQQGFERFGGTYGYNTSIDFPFQGDTPPSVFGFNITKIAGNPVLLDAQLLAMETHQHGRILSAPRVLTLDNQEAVIKQGVEYPYFEESESGGRTVKFKDIDLELKVKPHITRDRRVRMEITIYKNDIAGLVDGVPYIATKQTRTELLVDDGNTIVIGGIIKSTQRSGTSGVPWLSKIPILGLLFKTQSRATDKEELLVFITPRIVQLEQRSAPTAATRLDTGGQP